MSRLVTHDDWVRTQSGALADLVASEERRRNRITLESMTTSDRTR
jgi:hypothetical protein